MADNQNSEDKTKSTTGTPTTTPEPDIDDLLGPTVPVTSTKDDPADDPLKDEPDIELP